MPPNPTPSTPGPSRSRKSLVDFAVQYWAALVSSAAGLGCLSALAHLMTTEAEFARVSSMLAQYTMYAVVLELGVTIEGARWWAGRRVDTAALTAILVLVRGGLALLAFAGGVVQAIVSRFTAVETLGLLLLLLSLFPYAVLLSLDGVFIAQGRHRAAILAKLSRAIAFVVVPAAAWLLPEAAAWLVLAAYTAGVTAVALVILARRHRLPWPLFDHAREHLLPFVAGWLPAAWPPLLMAALFLGLNGLLYRVQGVETLATFAVAVSLVGPISLGMQAANQLALRALAARSRPFWQLITRTLLVHAALSALGAVLVGVAWRLGLLVQVFPTLGTGFLTLFFARVAAEFVANAAVPFGVKFQLVDPRRYALLATVVYLAAGVGGMVLTVRHGAIGNILGIGLVHAAAAVALSLGLVAMRKAR